MNVAKTTMKGIWRGVLVAASAILPALIGVASAAAAPPMDKHFYLPDAAASKIVSVAKTGDVRGGGDRFDGGGRDQGDGTQGDRR